MPPLQRAQPPHPQAFRTASALLEQQQQQMDRVASLLQLEQLQQEEEEQARELELQEQQLEEELALQPAGPGPPRLPQQQHQQQRTLPRSAFARWAGHVHEQQLDKYPSRVNNMLFSDSFTEQQQAQQRLFLQVHRGLQLHDAITLKAVPCSQALGVHASCVCVCVCA